MIYKLYVWIASCLIMTNLVTPSLRGGALSLSKCTKKSRSSRLYLDCFVPRNDGDLIVITLFCRGFFSCPVLAMTIRVAVIASGAKQSRR